MNRNEPLELGYAVLNTIIGLAMDWEPAHLQAIAELMVGMEPAWWGSDFAATVADAIQDHIARNARFGFRSLEALIPGEEWAALKRSEPFENVQVAFNTLAGTGKRYAVQRAMANAANALKDGDPEEIAASLLADLEAMRPATRPDYRVGRVGDVVAYREQVLADPGAIAKLDPALTPFLQWGGLPLTGQDAETIILCGRSGSGKTTLALHWAVMLASQGVRVAYHVMADASALELKQRLVFMVAGLPQSGTPSNDTMCRPTSRYPAQTVRDRLEAAQREVDALPIEIIDESPVSQHALRARLRRDQAQGVQFSVFDNLDHFTWDAAGGGNKERRDALGEMVNIIRQHDKATGHHSLILAQANRETNNNPDKIPLPHNTQDSDQPKNHCTLFIGLRNPALDEVKTEEDKIDDQLRLFIGKNRRGKLGGFRLPSAILGPPFFPYREAVTK